MSPQVERRGILSGLNFVCPYFLSVGLLRVSTAFRHFCSFRHACCEATPEGSPRGVIKGLVLWGLRIQRQRINVDLDTQKVEFPRHFTLECRLPDDAPQALTSREAVLSPSSVLLAGRNGAFLFINHTNIKSSPSFESSAVQR